MMFTRSNPSPRYSELLNMYKVMHVEGEKFLNISANNTFPGLSMPGHAPRIKKLIDATNSKCILDYGSGKGRQYEQDFKLEANAPEQSIIDYWGVDYVQCYDPCYEPYSKLPGEKYDGVICTDVLEHCPEADIPWIVEEIFYYSRKFVFANIACYPAHKMLPNGENAHTTIKPITWWHEVINEVYQKADSVLAEILIKEKVIGSNGKGKKWTRLRLGKAR